MHCPLRPGWGAVSMAPGALGAVGPCLDNHPGLCILKTCISLPERNPYLGQPLQTFGSTTPIIPSNCGQWKAYSCPWGLLSLKCGSRSSWGRPTHFLPRAAGCSCQEFFFLPKKEGVFSILQPPWLSLSLLQQQRKRGTISASPAKRWAPGPKRRGMPSHRLQGGGELRLS